MLHFVEFLHTRVFRKIVDFLYNFTLLKSMVTGLCHCVSVSLYHLINHRVCFNSDDIGSKRIAITTRPGHVNGISKTGGTTFWSKMVLAGPLFG